jgi:hypothetical protein
VTLDKDDRIRATQGVREINAGDTGVIVARWAMPTVTVRWDKDGRLRRINRKRLEKLK